MAERLRVHFDLPEALADIPVAPLLLQPLVENSVRHGLEPAVAGGRIDISAASAGSELLLRVRDTGVGLGSARADCLEPATDEHSAFGLVQVRERLAALYGTRASLQLVPGPDPEGGTLAVIRMPLRA
jgi:sensor histidine kinase YesM